ncbi:MAG TPA: hypothetical protein VM889_03005 [Candidatus Thermoplasmatota archaeon]|nr:hypothetical protein [Candidatus Thermoplasmatota archaeon]
MDKQTKIVAVLLSALLLSVPAGISTDGGSIATGHTTYFDLSGFDPCLAGVTGIARMRIMWFNDQVLLDTTHFGPNRFVYIAESGAPDPRAHTLNKTGVVYTYKDPVHEHVWTTTEYQYFLTTEPDVDLDTGGTTVRGPSYTDGKLDAGEYGAGFNASAFVGPFYVYATEIRQDPLTNDPSVPNPDGSRAYNFVTLVDTCRFHAKPAGKVVHDASATDENAYNHPVGTSDHEHETFLVDIWVGEKPREGGLTQPQGRGAWVNERATQQGGAGTWQ